MSQNDRQGSHILVRLEDRLFGLPTLAVREMLACPRVTTVPRLPDHVRGLVNLRGEVLPLVDLRQRMGLRSRHQESADLVQMLHDREGDHQRWVDTVNACVREGREIDVQEDPHLCAFGRWHDAFHTENRVLSTALARFKQPHDEIHGAAVTIKRLLARGDDAGVQRELAALQANLDEMKRLFADAREKIATALQEIVVVIDAGERAFGITVDLVESVEPLKHEEAPPVVAGHALDAEGLVGGIARRVKDDATVMLLQPDVLAESLAGAAV